MFNFLSYLLMSSQPSTISSAERKSPHTTCRFQTERKDPSNSYTYFSLAVLLLLIHFGNSLNNSRSRCAVGLASELSLQCARNGPAVVTAVSDSGLLGCRPHLLCVTGPPFSTSFAFKAKNPPIASEDVKIGRILRKVLKMT